MNVCQNNQEAITLDLEANALLKNVEKHLESGYRVLAFAEYQEAIYDQEQAELLRLAHLKA